MLQYPTVLFIRPQMKKAEEITFTRADLRLLVASSMEQLPGIHI